MSAPWAAPFERSPALPRVLPFLVFLGLTVLQGKLFPGSQYWLYIAKTAIGAALLWITRPWVPEARWTFSPSAIAAGVGVAALWIGLEGLYPSLESLANHARAFLHLAPQKTKPTELWNPFAFFGNDSPVAWLTVVVRIAGSSLVVPVLEETFYRSFLYRTIVRADFLEEPLGRYHPAAFWICALIFGFGHREWLPGILCAILLQLLILRNRRLGDAILAHGIANLLLGLYVVSRNAWIFW